MTYAQQLAMVHQHIHDHQLAVEPKAVFSEQMLEIGQYLGQSNYGNLNRYRHKVCTLMGIFALPVSLLGLFQFFSPYVGSIGIYIDAQGIMQAIFTWLFEHAIGVTAYVVVLFGIIIYVFRLNSRIRAEVTRLIQSFLDKTPSDNRSS